MDRREKAKGEGRGGGAEQVYRNAEKEKAAGAAARAFSSQPGLIARTRVFIVDFYWGSGEEGGENQAFISAVLERHWKLMGLFQVQQQGNFRR